LLVVISRKHNLSGFSFQNTRGPIPPGDLTEENRHLSFHNMPRLSEAAWGLVVGSVGDLYDNARARTIIGDDTHE